MSRYSYPNLSSGLGNPVEPSSTLYQHPQNLYIEPPLRTQLAADAPTFQDTENLLRILTANNQRVKPSIHAKIHKGFFQVDEKWTCYRRNYFSVTCSFTLAPWTSNTTYYLETSDLHTEPIRSFAISISAVVNAQDSEVRELVQHTPKRDKQSEKKPDKVILLPHQHFFDSNVGSTGAHSHSYYPIPTHSGALTLDYNQQYASPVQSSQTPSQHTFERIQFQKATANNGKRRAQQQYYNLVVELHAEIACTDGSTQWMRVAKRLSDPMVVRGRSPGHYKDGRRDSSASMGPDNGGPGNSGDANRAHLPPNLGQMAYAQVPYMSYESQRGGPHYARHGPEYHQRSLGSTDQSSSTSPLMSSSSSSPLEYILFNDAMDGVESIDGISGVAPYQDLSVGLNSLVQKKSITTTDRPSHMSSVEFGSPADDREEPDRTFDDTFESMMPSYHGDQEDSSQYLRPPTASDRRTTVPIGQESNRATRSSESSYGRFDPVQNSLCT
jgi:meiosis-specific transcription factor NDT80